MTSVIAPRCALLVAFALVAAVSGRPGPPADMNAVAWFDFPQVGNEVQIH